MKTTKIKDNVFSSNQLAMSVVPIRELDHTKANTAINANSQMFFLNGTLSFDMAIVKAHRKIFLGIERVTLKYTE
jgi:hypothetical protein